MISLIEEKQLGFQFLLVSFIRNELTGKAVGGGGGAGGVKGGCQSHPC